MKKILDYIKDEKLKITILDNKLDILNYKDIIIFENNKIVVDCASFTLSIKGENLTINRLCDGEVLIVGKILQIEFR